MKTGISRKAVIAAVAMVVALPLLMWLRDYPWNLAVLLAAAVGLLVYMSLRTVEQLRGLHRR